MAAGVQTATAFQANKQSTTRVRANSTTYIESFPSFVFELDLTGYELEAYRYGQLLLARTEALKIPGASTPLGAGGCPKASASRRFNGDADGPAEIS